jgi:hypothetical protein
VYEATGDCPILKNKFNSVEVNMDENKLGFANPVNVSGIECHSGVLESDETWKLLRKQPNIKTIEEFLVLYNYVCEVSTIDISGSDYRALRNKNITHTVKYDGTEASDGAPSILARPDMGTPLYKQSTSSKSAPVYHQIDMDNLDPFEKKELANHWYEILSKAIEYGLKRSAESHQAAWLFCRLGNKNYQDYLQRKSLVQIKYNLSERRIRHILTKIDKRILDALGRLIDLDLYMQNKSRAKESK